MGGGQTKEEKQIEEQATKETLLECPVLLDLGHGTIRNRHEERLKDIHNEESSNQKIQVGYFYHPRLADFSEDAAITKTTDNRLKYVYRAPLKDSGKKLYYIYGTKVSDNDQGIGYEYRPQGKGYNWPDSYRKANNLYYDIIIIPKDPNGNDDSAENNIDDISDSVSGIMSNASSFINKDMFTLKLKGSDTVKMVAERISLQLLVPTNNIHIMWEKNVLRPDDVISEFVSSDDENSKMKTFTIQLRRT